MELKFEPRPVWPKDHCPLFFHGLHTLPMVKSRYGQQTCLYEDKKLDAMGLVGHEV